MNLTRVTTALAAVAATAVIGTGVANAETPQVTPVASQQANNAAMESFTAKVGVATATGGLVGTGVGFIIGCVIGGGLTAPTVVFVPLGCLTGGVTGASIGGVVGTLIVGGPTAVIAGVEMVQVLFAPAV